MLPLVFDDVPEEFVSFLGITCATRPEADMFDDDNPIEAVISTGVSYDTTIVLQTEIDLRKQRSGSTPNRANLKRAEERFSLEQELKQAYIEVEPVLLALSGHLHCTDEADKDILHVPFA